MQNPFQIYRSQIKYKIILPYLFLMLLVMLIGSGVAIFLVAGSLQERFSNQLGQVGRSFADGLARQEQNNVGFLYLVAFAQENPEVDAPAVAEALQAENEAGLEQALMPFFRTGTLRDNIYNVMLDRLIAFELDGQALVHWERAEGANLTEAERREPISHGSTDLSQLEPVQWVLADDADNFGDAYAAFIMFQEADAREQNFPNNDYYLFTVIPVYLVDNDTDERELVGGLLIATRLENLLTALDRQSQSEVSAIYDTSGLVLDSTVIPNAGLHILDMDETIPQQLVDQFETAEEVARCFDETLASASPRWLPGRTDQLACSVLDEVNFNERSYQFLYAPLIVRDTQVGYFSIGLSEDYITASWADSRNLVTTIALLLSGVTILIGYWIARQITNPLDDLVQTARAVAAGQLDHRSNVSRRDEFGTLSQAFNTMIDSLVDLSGALKTEFAQRTAVENISDAIYQALTQGLAAEKIDDIGNYTRPDFPADIVDLIPPGLDAVLDGLDQLARNTQSYLETTSPVSRRNILLQASEELEVIAAQVQNLPEPFSPLLGLVIERWRRVLTAEGGALARAQITGPVPNPYVAGNPVQGALFIGREDIMRYLEELWRTAGQGASVVLYGHRRMGKSSILRNMNELFDEKTVVVDFNMQRVGFVTSTGELFYNLALELYDALPPPQQTTLTEPEEERFTTQNPYTIFDRFLRQLDGARGEQRFIITLDEFELIEELIDAGTLEARLLAYWRGLIQTYPWFVMAFAGLHTLEELRHDYWHPLFGSITAIDVSFLSPEAARRLITQPAPDFNIDYDEAAIAAIIALTNGQPYLVQLVGHALVTRFNRQTFEEGKERPRRFAQADVEAVITAPEFYRDGNAYFSGVWAQAEGSEPAGQLDVLRALSHALLTEAELARVTELAPAQLRAALATLERHDVVALRTDGRYGYTVELMRRWVADRVSFEF